MNLLILDAGHNEYVAGKESPCKTFREWKFNMEMQEGIKKRAEDHKITVVLTNPEPAKKDEIGLSVRCNIANKAYKDKGKPKSLFISLHGNAYSDTSVRGTETFIASNASKNSKDAATYLQNEILSVMKSIDSKAVDRKVKTHNYYVVKNTIMPCCLIEYGFYTNKDDLAILKNNKKELIEATIKGICRYFGINYLPEKVVEPVKPLVSNKKPFARGDYNSYVVTTAVLNIREARNPNSNKVGQFPKGAKVEVWWIDKGTDGDLWGSCSCKGAKGDTGFINLRYCEPF